MAYTFETFKEDLKNDSFEFNLQKFEESLCENKKKELVYIAFNEIDSFSVSSTFCLFHQVKIIEHLFTKIEYKGGIDVPLTFRTGNFHPDTKFAAFLDRKISGLSKEFTYKMVHIKKKFISKLDSIARIWSLVYKLESRHLRKFRDLLLNVELLEKTFVSVFLHLEYFPCSDFCVALENYFGENSPLLTSVAGFEPRIIRAIMSSFKILWGRKCNRRMKKFLEFADPYKKSAEEILNMFSEFKEKQKNDMEELKSNKKEKLGQLSETKLEELKKMVGKLRSLLTGVSANAERFRKEIERTVIC